MIPVSVVLEQIDQHLHQGSGSQGELIEKLGKPAAAQSEGTAAHGDQAKPEYEILKTAAQQMAQAEAASADAGPDHMTDQDKARNLKETV